MKLSKRDTTPCAWSILELMQDIAKTSTKNHNPPVMTKVSVANGKAMATDTRRLLLVDKNLFPVTWFPQDGFYDLSAGHLDIVPPTVSEGWKIIDYNRIIQKDFPYEINYDHIGVVGDKAVSYIPEMDVWVIGTFQGHLALNANQLPDILMKLKMRWSKPCDPIIFEDNEKQLQYVLMPMTSKGSREFKIKETEK